MQPPGDGATTKRESQKRWASEEKAFYHTERLHR